MAAVVARLSASAATRATATSPVACGELIRIGDCQFNTVTPPICEVQPDARLRRSGGELWGNNIYNETGADQYVSMKIYAGDKRIVYITVQNDGAVADAFGFCPCQEISDPIGITISYFKGHSNTEMTGKSYTPVLQPGEKYVIRARVAVDANAVPGQLFAQLVDFKGAYSNMHDSVAIWVQRK